MGLTDDRSCRFCKFDTQTAAHLSQKNCPPRSENFESNLIHSFSLYFPVYLILSGSIPPRYSTKLLGYNAFLLVGHYLSSVCSKSQTLREGYKFTWHISTPKRGPLKQVQVSKILNTYIVSSDSFPKERLTLSFWVIV